MITSLGFIGVIIIIFIVFCVAGICADTAIIYTIFRFKRLRTPSNIFLANWAISDLFSLILIPISYVIMMLTKASSAISACIFVQGGFILHVTVILFGAVLCIDWCIAAYFRSASEKFRKHYQFVIASVWIVTFLFYVLSIGLCMTHMDYSVPIVLFIICYSFTLIFVIGLQCSRVAQKCRDNPVSYPKPLTLRLTLITVITVSYLLAVINMLLIYFEVYYTSFFPYLLVSAIISVFAIVSSSVVTLVLLCCLNYDFRSCLFQIRKPSHERFDNANSEFEEDTVKDSSHAIDDTRESIS